MENLKRKLKMSCLPWKMCTMQENVSLYIYVKIVKSHISHEKRATLIMKEIQKTNVNKHVECHFSSKEPCFSETAL